MASEKPTSRQFVYRAGSRFVRQRVYKSYRNLTSMSDDRLRPERRHPGHKPLAGRDRKPQVKRKEAKANDIDEEIFEEKTGDSSSRLEAPTNRRRTRETPGLLRSLKSETTGLVAAP
jgi:hypothetical protein